MSTATNTLGCGDKDAVIVVVHPGSGDARVGPRRLLLLFMLRIGYRLLGIRWWVL